jgi:hypothetical protein
MVNLGLLAVYTKLSPNARKILKNIQRISSDAKRLFAHSPNRPRDKNLSISVNKACRSLLSMQGGLD